MVHLRLKTSILLISLSSAASAQQQKVETVRLSQAPQRVEYVLQVRTPEGCLISPIGPHKRGALVYALGRPKRYLPDEYGRPIVSRVNFLASQAGDMWNIRASVGIGEFFDVGDQQLGSLTMVANESLEIIDDNRFGLPAFRVGVFKLVGDNRELPQVRNLIPSITIERLENTEFPNPLAVTLKNGSAKDIVALQYNTYKGSQLLFLKWTGSDVTKPLIKAGESFRLQAMSEDKSCSDAGGYTLNQANRLDVVSAVFADGSYEGESGLAALIRGTAYGNKKQLERFLGSSAAGSDALGNPASYAAFLRSFADWMDEHSDQQLLESLLSGLPPQSPDATFTMNNFIRAGLHQVKVSLKRDADVLDHFIATQNEGLIQAQMTRIRDKYKQWFEKASAIAGN